MTNDEGQAPESQIGPEEGSDPQESGSSERLFWRDFDRIWQKSQKGPGGGFDPREIRTSYWHVFSIL